MRSPRIVTSFILVFVFVHVASRFLTPDQYDFLIENFALIPAHIAAVWGGGEVFGWNGLMAAFSLLSYAFLHADFVHLLFNSVWFLIFGTAVARRVGMARFLLLSVLATLGAAAAHLAFHWGLPVPVVGASGAVSGLMGAAFRFIFIDPATTPVWPPALLKLTSRPVLMASGVWIVLNIVLGVTGFTPEGFGSSIAWEAHIGGFLTGLFLFPLFDRQRSWIS